MQWFQRAGGWVLGLCVLAGGGVLGAASSARAQDIPPIYVRFETFDAILGANSDRSIRGFFDLLTDRVFDARFPETRRQFQRFQDEASAAVDQVPIPSGSVSIAYKFDPTLETYVRSTNPFSPALSLNARTDGRGVVTIGTSYSHVDYDEFDGQDRDGVVLIEPLVDSSGREFVDAQLLRFKLRQSIFTTAFSYGVLDNLDVGIAIPVFEQSFDASLIDGLFLRNDDGSLQPALVASAADGTTAVFADGGRAATRRIDLGAFSVPRGRVPLPGITYDDDAYGVGDVILRARAFIGSLGPAETGAAIGVSLPTGDEDDLMGVDGVRVDPRLILSWQSERFAVHTNQGFHADFDEGDRNRYEYSVGGELAVVPWLSLLVDQVGRMEISGGDSVQRFEVVPGIKANPYGTIVVGFNAIVPLNDEGLRTDFTPNATAEISLTF